MRLCYIFFATLVKIVLKVLLSWPSGQFVLVWLGCLNCYLLCSSSKRRTCLISPKYYLFRAARPGTFSIPSSFKYFKNRVTYLDFLDFLGPFSDFILQTVTFQRKWAFLGGYPIYCCFFVSIMDLKWFWLKNMQWHSPLVKMCVF